MKEPTFAIAGAQRCGTTWLYHLLDEHPEIYMAKPVHPEPKFFLNETSSESKRQSYLNQWFNRAVHEIAVGEKSTSYMEFPGVPRRMKQLFPKLKVVFLLRHPVERAISNYRLSRQHGLETESLEFALRNEPDRLANTTFPHTSVHPFAYQRRGHYARDIVRFLKFFGSHEIQVVQLENLLADPLQTLSNLFAFLDVAANFCPRNVTSDYNESPPDDLKISRELLSELLERFYPSNRTLEQLCDCDVRQWDDPTDALLSMVK